MNFIYNDGGRKAAGFRGDTGDCVVRAIAIATQIPYQEVYDGINELAQRERRGVRKRGISTAARGVYRNTYDRYLTAHGWTWTPTMKIGSGCKVHLTDGELPANRRLIVVVSRHLTAVINGAVHDTHDPQRGTKRCVYGYWSKP